MGELLTIKELQAKLKISRKVAYDLCKHPDFPVCRIGGKILVAEDQLQAWINAGGTGQREPPDRRRS